MPATVRPQRQPPVPVHGVAPASSTCVVLGRSVSEAMVVVDVWGGNRQACLCTLSGLLLREVRPAWPTSLLVAAQNWAPARKHWAHMHQFAEWQEPRSSRDSSLLCSCTSVQGAVDVSRRCQLLHRSLSHHAHTGTGLAACGKGSDSLPWPISVQISFLSNPAVRITYPSEVPERKRGGCEGAGNPALRLARGSSISEDGPRSRPAWQRRLPSQAPSGCTRTCIRNRRGLFNISSMRVPPAACPAFFLSLLDTSIG